MASASNWKEEAARYELLAEGFWNVPSSDYLEKLRASLAVFEGESENAKKGTGFITDYFEMASEGCVRELALDFTSTFIGTNADDPFPYESIYFGEQRLLKQECCDDVCRIYRKNGFIPNSAESNEPEDYLSTMLSFLSFMCTKADDASVLGDEKGAASAAGVIEDFKTGHLRNWVPRFCDEVEAKADTSFYKGLTYLALAAIER